MDDLITMPNGLFARPNTSDEGTWHDVFDEDKAWHRYPEWLEPTSLIVDLGANVGYTTWDYRQLSDTIIIAVEPDRENMEVLRKNLANTESIMTADYAVSYYKGYANISGTAFNNKKINPDPALIVGDVRVITVDEVVSYFEDDVIDFIKFDIEGAEKDILGKEGEWVNRTRCIKVEFHAPYSKEDCARDISKLGFDVFPDPNFEYTLLGYKKI